MEDQEIWSLPAADPDDILPFQTNGQPSPSPHSRVSPKIRSTINRTRTGCRTCRSRKVKCDENKPLCTQCRRGRRACYWPGPDEKRAKISRRPNATACDTCRAKKLKCVGNLNDACDKCTSLGIDCVRSQQSDATAPYLVSMGDSSSNNDMLAPISPAVLSPTVLSPSVFSRTKNDLPAPTQPQDVSEASLDNHMTTESPPLGQMPTGTELEALVNLYFSSVHHFGFFAFIHQLHFNRLLSKGSAPRELTLMMIASAMRFAARPTPENLARADAWADAAIGALLPRIYQGFGAIQLMVLLLAQHYDLNRGHFTSAWLLGANCTRMMQMMSLQTFDRTYPTKFSSNLRLSPLLTHEALRRVAWCTLYVDTIVDGGRYGFHIADEKAYRLQLPCDQASFLGDEMVVTETLFNDQVDTPKSDASHLERAPLDMSAFLLRTAAARRRALHFAFRASHKERTVEELSDELKSLETDIEDVVAALPKRFHFNTDNLILNQDRLITFILLHVLRHNLFIVTGRAALQVFLRDPAKADLIPQVRRNRISHALPIAGLISEGLKAGISFDPQIGVQAYVALEILLFEPRRLTEIDPSIDPKAPEIMEAIPHLLAVIRQIADRSEFVKQLHIEAVHRLLRCDCMPLLNETDFTTFQSEYRLVGQDAAEYDFRDFRWAKLERLRRGARLSTNAARDEALLEYKVGGETVTPSAAPSPRLDALDVHNIVTQPLANSSLSFMAADSLTASEVQSGVEESLGQNTQPWWGVADPEKAEEMFSIDWPWLLDESGHPGYQTGDPTMFWNQLQQS